MPLIIPKQVPLSVIKSLIVNSIVSGVNTIEANLLSEISNSVNELYLKLIPKFFIQFTDTNGSFRDEDSPVTIFGGVWTELFTDGTFFRVRGGTDEPVRNSSGYQSDCIRNITGRFWGANESRVNMYADGVFGLEYNYGGLSSARDSDNAAIIFNARYAVPVGSENRPVNRLMKIFRYEGHSL